MRELWELWEMWEMWEGKQVGEESDLKHSCSHDDEPSAQILVEKECHRPRQADQSLYPLAAYPSSYGQAPASHSSSWSGRYLHHQEDRVRLHLHGTPAVTIALTASYGSYVAC